MTNERTTRPWMPFSSAMVGNFTFCCTQLRNVLRSPPWNEGIVSATRNGWSSTISSSCTSTCWITSVSSSKSTKSTSVVIFVSLVTTCNRSAITFTSTFLGGSGGFWSWRVISVICSSTTP